MGMSTDNKLWFSFFDRDGYKGNEPAFFDVNKISWTKLITENSDIIIQEFKNSGLDAFTPYFNQSAVNEKNIWKTIAFKAWTVNYYKTQKKFPKTMEVLNQVPGLMSASINKLEAGGHIVPHHGDSNGIYRCHMGLDIPAKLPDAGFKVSGESRSWGNGELLVFCDANMHEAWNKSKDDRYILLFDVVRPEYLNRKQKLVHTVTASLYLQGLAQKIPFLHKLPRIVQGGIHFSAMISSIVYIPVRNMVAKIFS